MSSTSNSANRPPRIMIRQPFQGDDTPSKMYALIEEWIWQSRLYRVSSITVLALNLMLSVYHVVSRAFDMASVMCISSVLLDLAQLVSVSQLRHGRPSILRLFLICTSFMNLFLSRIFFATFDAEKKYTNLRRSYTALKMMYMMYLVDFIVEEFWYQNIPEKDTQGEMLLSEMKSLRSSANTPFKPAFATL